ENIALFHFAGNAFLRTYQLLASPSVVTYLIREQFFHFIPGRFSLKDGLRKRLEYSLYILSLKEWNFDDLMSHYVWEPFKRLGKRFRFLSIRNLLVVFIPLYAGSLLLIYDQEMLPNEVHAALPYFFSLIALVMVIRSFAEKQNVKLAWSLIILNH